MHADCGSRPPAVPVTRTRVTPQTRVPLYSEGPAAVTAGTLGVLSSKAPTQTGLKLKPQNSGLIAATRPTQPSHSTDRAGWLPLRGPGHQGFIYFNFCLRWWAAGQAPVPCPVFMKY